MKHHCKPQDVNHSWGHRAWSMIWLELIVSQVNGEYATRGYWMAAYLKVIFKIWEQPHDLSASAVDFQFRREIHIEHIAKPSIDKLDEEVFHLDHSLGWRDIISFLKDRTKRSPKTRLNLRSCNTSPPGTYSSESSYTKKKIIFQTALQSISEVPRAKGSQECEKIHHDDCENHGMEGLSRKAIIQGYY